MGFGYRILAFIIGVLAIIGGAASIVVPAQKAAKIKENSSPQTAIVQTIERPVRKNLQPYTIIAVIDAGTNTKKSIEVESYTYHRPGSPITVYVDPVTTEAIVSDKGSSWLSTVISVFLIGFGVLMVVLAFLSKKAHAGVNKSLRPLAQASLSKPGLDTKDSKWTTPAMVTSLFNLTLIAAPITAPLSIVFGILALNDIKKNHKTGKKQVVFTFVFSGIFVLGIIALAIAR